jgi:hypothetical protein
MGESSEGKIAEWVLRRSPMVSFGFGFGTGGYGHHTTTGVGVGTSVSPPPSGEYLRLRFDKDGKLAEWTRVRYWQTSNLWVPLVAFAAPVKGSVKVQGRKQIPEVAKNQRFMNKPPLRDIFRSEVLRDKRKRDKSIGEAVFEHGYTQGEVADHLRIHFTSVSRILRAKDKMLKK